MLTCSPVRQYTDIDAYTKHWRCEGWRIVDADGKPIAWISGQTVAPRTPGIPAGVPFARAIAWCLRYVDRARYRCAQRRRLRRVEITVERPAPPAFSEPTIEALVDALMSAPGTNVTTTTREERLAEAAAGARRKRRRNRRRGNRSRGRTRTRTSGATSSERVADRA